MQMFRKVIDILATCCHVLVNVRFLSRCESARIAFYSSWVRHEFASCGSDSYFSGFSTLKGGRYIRLGSRLYVGRDVIWEVYDEYRSQHFTPSLSFGNGSSFGDGGHITCINHITIGSGVRIGRKVFITDNAHGLYDLSQLDTPPNLRPLVSKGPVVIEDNVWIGEMACIMPGVTIGRGAIVGANAVVTHDVPPYSIFAGNPARVVKNFSGL